MKIFKYQIEDLRSPDANEDGNNNEYTLPIVKGAIFLSLVNQYDKPTFYFAVDEDEKETENRTFVVYETGHIVTTIGETIFLGTIVTTGGNFVLHIFRKKQ